VHVTWHDPSQSASQLDTFAQTMLLPEPACTPHLETLWQSYVQWSPQMTLQVETSWQTTLQPLPQDDVHSFVP
jgi:hypothetical protein